MQRTASQTVGPFFLDALIHAGDEVIFRAGTAGEAMILEGNVLDAEGTQVNDSVLELFQADAAGQYALGNQQTRSGGVFSGFGRATMDTSGKFRFHTVYPGVVRGANMIQAPHFDLMVFARGLLKPLVTRIYFEADSGNATDPVLALVPAHRRGTLLARRDATAGQSVWRFDVHLQGKDETVFFDF